MTAQDDPNRISYDDQATVFEGRTGLPPQAARQVADAVFDYANLVAGDLIVEIGAGTGVLGQWLARAPYKYLGFDNSEPMLEVFSPRLPAADAILVNADAEERWPVTDGTAAVVFGSRVLHLLRAEHVIREAARVARPGGAVLICGHLEHDPSSPRSTARQKLRQLLAAQGLQPRRARGEARQLFVQAQAAGAEVLPPRVAASWPESVRVSQVIEGWRGKTSIGGINPPPEVVEAVLTALTAWAARTYGESDAAVTTETQYVLEGIRVSAPRGTRNKGST
jgi:ubiquinone/menaquinone biosynthesis C-methylase UbiE